MADDIWKTFALAVGWEIDKSSEAAAKKSVKDYEAAFIQAEKAIEDARWAGAKTEQEVAKLTRETNLKLAKEALQKAKDEEARRVEADKRQAEQLKVAKQRLGDFVNVVAGVGAAISAAAIGVQAGVVKMAQGFDALKFTSERSGASVRSIQAIGYAASQMGSSVAAGVGSLESFARTLRDSPGSYDILERLGIKTKDGNGVRRSADALFLEFGKSLKEKSPSLQHQYLQDFGIDEKTGYALLAGMEKYTAEYNEKLKKTGLDPDKAAKDAAALQRTFGSLAASFEIIGQKVASKLFDGENNGFQKFVDWLDAHGDQIAEVIAHIAQVVVELAKGLLQLVTSPEAKRWFDQLMLAFGEFNKETGKFEVNVDKMKVALGLLGTYVAVDWLKKILGAFGLLGAGWSGLLRTFGIPIAIGTVATGHGYQTPEQYQESLATDPEAKRFDDERKAQGGGLKRMFQRGYSAVKRALGGGSAEAHTRGVQGIGGNAGANAESDETVTTHGHRWKPGSNTAAGRERVSSWLQFFQASIKEGGLGTDAETARAMVAMMQGESDASLRPDAKGDHRNGVPTAFGTAQWRLERFEALKAMAARMNTNWTDVGAQQQHFRNEVLNGKYRGVWNRIVAAPTGEEKLRAGIEGFEVPKYPDKAYDFRVHYLRALRRAPQDRPATPDNLEATSSKATAPAAPKMPAMTARDVFPRGMPPVFQGGAVPSFITSPQPPNYNSADNSRTMLITMNQGDINVRGVDDGRRTAEHVGAVQGYRNSDLIRNLRSSLA